MTLLQSLFKTLLLIGACVINDDIFSYAQFESVILIDKNIVAFSGAGGFQSDNHFQGVVTNVSHTIRFWIKTSRPDSLILGVSAVGNSDNVVWNSASLAIVTKDGQLKIKFGAGQESSTILSDEFRVDDGSWHGVVISFFAETRTYNIFIDGVKAVESTVLTSNIDAAKSIFVVGSMQQAPAPNFNGKLLDLLFSAGETYTDETVSMVYGTDDTSPQDAEMHLDYEVPMNTTRLKLSATWPSDLFVVSITWSRKLIHGPNASSSGMHLDVFYEVPPLPLPIQSSLLILEEGLKNDTDASQCRTTDMESLFSCTIYLQYDSSETLAAAEGHYHAEIVFEDTASGIPQKPIGAQMLVNDINVPPKFLLENSDNELETDPSYNDKPFIFDYNIMTVRMYVNYTLGKPERDNGLSCCVYTTKSDVDSRTNCKDITNTISIISSKQHSDFVTTAYSSLGTFNLIIADSYALVRCSLIDVEQAVFSRVFDYRYPSAYQIRTTPQRETPLQETSTFMHINTTPAETSDSVKQPRYQQCLGLIVAVLLMASLFLSN